MADVRSFRQIVELQACGPDDPDGLRTASALSAYFAAEHAQIFRRLMWRRLAVIALIAWLLEATTSLLSGTVLLATFVVLGAIAIAAAIDEWRAQQKLQALLDARTNS